MNAVSQMKFRPGSNAKIVSHVSGGCVPRRWRLTMKTDEKVRRERRFGRWKEGTRGQLTGEKGYTLNDWWHRAFGCICQAIKMDYPSFSLPGACRIMLIGPSRILELSLQWPLLKTQKQLPNLCQTGIFPSAAFMMLLILVPVVLPLSRTCLFEAGFIHLSSNAHSLLCHFPWWPPTLTSVIFPAVFLIHAASWLPFFPLFSTQLSSVLFFLYLNTEWPLLVVNVLTGCNFTSFSWLGDIRREISLALAVDCSRPCVLGHIWPLLLLLNVCSFSVYKIMPVISSW